jgi:hypothetical protein
VDTKKKELIGNFKNGGTDYRPKGDPRRVKVHDFEDKTLGKVTPYGIYDVAADEGWVSVGITADTAQFAVQSIRTWLERMGRQRYPPPRELTITADCGGSNGARVRLWKLEPRCGAPSIPAASGGSSNGRAFRHSERRHGEDANSCRRGGAYAAQAPPERLVGRASHQREVLGTLRPRAAWL